MSDKIFISCSSKDTAAALTICEAIEARGYGCWIACRDVRAGHNFQEEIVQFLRAAPLMVLVFSANANDSNEIKKELAIASQYNLTVIPVRIDDVTPGGAFIYELATRQWIDLFGNWEKAMQTLVAQIAASLPSGPSTQTPLEPPPPPRPLPSGPNKNLPWIVAGVAVLLLLVGVGLNRSGLLSPQSAVTPPGVPQSVAVAQPTPQIVTAPTPSASPAPKTAASAATAKPAPEMPAIPARPTPAATLAQNTPAATGSSQPTLTCQFNSGPKSGYIQDFRMDARAIPTVVGGGCTDGQGSMGLGIPDRPTQSTLTCQFFYGAKAGRVEDFRGTSATPAIVGGGCTDGQGSNGLGIPDRPAQSTLTCQYFYGPRAGQIQDFRGTNARPAIVGGPCTDGQGSNGLGIPNR